MKDIPYHSNRIILPVKPRYIKLMTFGVRIWDLRDCRLENNRGFGYVLVVKDNFSNFGMTVPLKNKNDQTKEDSFEMLFINSKRKQNLIETDQGKELYNSFFQNFINNNNIKHYSRNSSFGAVYAERYKFFIRDLLKRPGFEKGDGNWIDVLPVVTKH